METREIDCENKGLVLPCVATWKFSVFFFLNTFKRPQSHIRVTVHAQEDLWKLLLLFHVSVSRKIYSL